MNRNNIHKRKKWPFIVLGLLIVLVVLRLALPFIVLKYVNKTLKEMDGYSGHVEDIDISLYRGAYTIKQINIVSTAGKVPVPFFSADYIDLSVEWRALFKGSLVGEIEMHSPRVNFVSGPSKASSQTGMGNDWKKQVKALFPLKINRFEIFNGQIHYNDFHSQPKVDLYMKNVYGLAKNLTNSEKLSNTLSADAHATGTVMNSGKFFMNVKLDPFSEKPTFNIDAKVEKMNVKELNEFILAYGKFDVQGGKIGIYLEAACTKGKIKGYVKPLIEDLNILKPKEEKLNPLRFLYEAAMEGVTTIFENQPNDRVATKVNFSGDYDNPDIDIWSIMGNLLKNAFIKVLLPQLDNTIGMQDAASKDADKKMSKEEKKEQKQERKEERKEKRERKRAEKERDKK